MLAAAALLLAVQAPAAEASPDRAMLEAFEATCSRIGNVEQALAAARTLGWEPADIRDPRIVQLQPSARRLGRYTLAPVFFRRVVAGRELFLAISEPRDLGLYRSRVCRVWHFEAVEPIDSRLIDVWAGRSVRMSSLAPGITGGWEPEWRDGISLEIAHIAPDSPWRGGEWRFGNVLTAQANEGM
jgi:hypothetical protein